MTRIRVIVLAAFLTACVNGSDDFDGDGTLDAFDCEPGDPAMNEQDHDGDGSSTCGGDCDDGDATRDALDRDGDGTSSCAGDCDDLLAAVYPGAAEGCDGRDSDCDGVLPPEERDNDSDGEPLCGDCDDNNQLVFPGAKELCDGLDNDCDNLTPGGEQDEDGDGIRPCGGDCDDQDATRAPGLVDICNNRDDDCDGEQDEDTDTDGDGFCLGDCDDADSSVFPGNWADAAPGADSDGQDQSCDGEDGFTGGSAAVTVTLPDGFGRFVHAETDLTGDGVVDVVVGNEGGVFVYSGDALATLMSTQWQSQLGEADAAFTITPFGEAVQLGDLDGDGAAEMAVTGGRTVRVLSGTETAGQSGALTLEAVASWEIEGSDWDDLFGASVSSALRGSGTAPDLLVGASGFDAGAGRAYVFLGEDLAAGPITIAAAAQTVDWPSGDGLGLRVQWIGDVDGDSVRDYILGTDVWPAGQLFVMSGALLPTAASIPTDAIASLGPGSDVGFGEYGFIDLGDLDGDGLDEVLVSERIVGHWLFTGAQIAAGGSISSADAAARLRFPSVATGPNRRPPRMVDVDGDGGRDLVLGIPGNSSCDSGLVIVSRPELEAALSAGGETQLASVGWLIRDSESECEELGYDFALADLDGDAKPEIIVGAPRSNYVVAETGRLYVFRNPF